MGLPFTVEAFLDVFRRYNDAVWPLQWLLGALGIAAVALAARGGPRAGRRVSGILTLLWLWTGLVYHVAFFRAINPAAAAFGAACVAQAALFAGLGVGRGRIAFAPRRDVAGVAGATLAAYALVVYPMLGAATGRAYPASPTFGTPCPTTILTLALLLWAVRTLPRVVLIVPVAWSVIGTVGALRLGVVEDLGLPIAAAAASLATVLEHRGHRGTTRLRAT
jgi:hypothetical protein